MAERRMFAKTIIDSDAFLDLPATSQNLYFHLGMRADDDGFVNNPKRILRTVGANDDDLKLLAVKKFVIPFSTGVCVVTHWKIHNYIQKDRYKETAYTEEKKSLIIKENGAYAMLDTECIQDVSNMYAQISIGKGSIDKSKDKKEYSPAEPSIAHEIIGYLNQKAGTNYKPTGKATLKHVNARLNEGFKREDFITVIDKKCVEWLCNPSMVAYLRPETLFGSKFEGYLNQPVSDKGGSNYATGNGNRDEGNGGYKRPRYGTVLE